MLAVLSASAAAPRPAPARFMLAAALHGVILYAAARPGTPVPDMPALVREVVLQPVEPGVREPDPSAPRRAGGEAAIVPGPGQTFALPTPDVPAGIPPVSLGPALDLSALRRFTAGIGAPGGGDPGTGAEVLLAAEVDEPAAAIRQPSPRYPPVLQQAGIEGKVLLEFIIDSTGHVEPASVRAIDRSGPGFDATAREVIQKSLFRPARVRGRPVRQRTLQSIVFRIR